MAQRLGLSAADVALIRDAAPLHDIGKLAVPDAVLLKAGDLSADEFAVMKEHTTSGAAILAGSRSDVLRLGEEIALTHHEWWDGNGYPAPAQRRRDPRERADRRPSPTSSTRSRTTGRTRRRGRSKRPSPRSASSPEASSRRASSRHSRRSRTRSC